VTQKGPDIGSVWWGVGDKRVVSGCGADGHFVEQVERVGDAVGEAEVEKEDGVGEDGVGV
jgi:hypothetical protein